MQLEGKRRSHKICNFSYIIHNFKTEGILVLITYSVFPSVRLTGVDEDDVRAC